MVTIFLSEKVRIISVCFPGITSLVSIKVVLRVSNSLNMVLQLLNYSKKATIRWDLALCWHKKLVKQLSCL